MKKLRLLAALLTVSVTMSMPAVAFAVGYGGVGGRPAHPQTDNPRTKSIFIYALKDGRSASDGVTIYNNTNKRQTISVVPVDSVLSSGGSFACAQNSEPKKDVGAWIKLQTSEVTLSANSSKTVPFTVTVPQNADVGEHDGCIAIQADSATKPTSKSGVLLSFRSAIRVVVTIPGKIVKKLTLNSIGIDHLKNDDYVISPVAQNEGNVSLDTDVQIKLASIFGPTIGTKGGTYPVLPRSKATWNFEYKHPFWGGWYHAYTTATYNSNPTAELGVDQGASKTVKLTSTVFFVAPTGWGGLIEALIVLALVAAGWFFLKKQRDIRHIREHWIDYKAKKDDDIKSVAAAHHTSWKKLVRVNKIKPPYDLHKDQKLKVPPKPKEPKE
jgi:WxL Interacting Protein, peptidoglycan binding domain/LysM domain